MGGEGWIWKGHPAKGRICYKGIKVEVLESVVGLVQPAVGNTNLALQHCKAAVNQGLADKRALFLVLSGWLMWISSINYVKY